MLHIHTREPEWFNTVSRFIEISKWKTSTMYSKKWHIYIQSNSKYSKWIREWSEPTNIYHEDAKLMYNKWSNEKDHSIEYRSSYTNKYPRLQFNREEQ